MALMLNPGRVLTRSQLLGHVRDYDFGGSSTVATTYVAYLRRKLAACGPGLIRTQRGIGYSLRLPGAGDAPGRGTPPPAPRSRAAGNGSGFREPGTTSPDS